MRTAAPAPQRALPYTRVMETGWYRDAPSGPGPVSQVLRTVFAVVLAFAALWLGFIASALLMLVTPAVLPGASFSPPGLSWTLERMPGDLAVSSPGPDHPFNEPIDILVMGADRRPDESALDVRTDSIALLRLDPATHHATILSIPRDLWVSINTVDGETYPQRINVSYTVGARAGGSIEAGAEQLARDIQVNFGVEVDHYIWLDMAGTRQLVDALGGVTVTIPESLAVPEWRYTEDDETNPQNVSFPPGEHHLSGYEAVAFSRYRGDSDLYRAQRQQLVLRALLADPFSPRVLLNPIGAWRAAASTVESDLSTPRLAGLAYLSRKSSANTELYSLGEDVGGSPTVMPMTTAEGAAVLDWDPANVAYWFEQARATR